MTTSFDFSVHVCIKYNDRHENSDKKYAFILTSLLVETLLHLGTFTHLDVYLAILAVAIQYTIIFSIVWLTERFYV